MDKDTKKSFWLDDLTEDEINEIAGIFINFSKNVTKVLESKKPLHSSESKDKEETADILSNSKNTEDDKTKSHVASLEEKRAKEDKRYNHL